MRIARFDSGEGKKLLALLFFLDRNNLTTLIVTAIGANGMRGAHFATIGTVHNRYQGEGIMRASAVAATARMFTFWLWNHDFS
jgi:hypothetical protein